MGPFQEFEFGPEATRCLLDWAWLAVCRDGANRDKTDRFVWRFVKPLEQGKKGAGAPTFRLMPKLAPYKICVTLDWVSDMNERPAALNLI